MSFKEWFVIEVACDGCDEVHDTAQDASSEDEALNAAEHAGWQVRGEEVFCPRCPTPAGPSTYPLEPTREDTKSVMSSALQIGGSLRPRRRRHFISAVVAALAVVAVTVSGGETGRPPGLEVSATPSTGAAASQGSLTLPQGASLAGGRWPVRFPHTAPGAVAALAATLNAVWSLDGPLARQAANVYTSPADRAHQELAAARAVQHLRSGLGLKPGDPIPHQAYARVSSVGTRYRKIDADRVLVALLVEISSATAPNTTASTLRLPVKALMVWDSKVRGGDWVFTANNDPSFPLPDPAAPGTPQFAAAGWTPIDSARP